ncbi:MAG TPA: response regulator transcription factor [Terriglobales bacterium]
MDAVRILVVDDQEVVRRGISSLLADEPGMTVVAQATSGTDAVKKAEEHQPDIVLLDLGIPELNGLLVTPMIKKVAPRSEVLIVTQYDHPYLANHAFASGARGFLSKLDLAEQLIQAVHQVAAKHRFVSRGVKAASVTASVKVEESA